MKESVGKKEKVFIGGYLDRVLTDRLADVARVEAGGSKAAMLEKVANETVAALSGPGGKGIIAPRGVGHP